MFYTRGSSHETFEAVEVSLSVDWLGQELGRALFPQH